jgi:hypothetical protein
MSAFSIFDMFGHESESSAQLRELYGIYYDRPVSSKLGALDFLNDMRFSLPAEAMVSEWCKAQRPVFRFLVDQPNPWQTSSRAHHGVDLLYLFGGYDLSFDQAAMKVSLSMQRKWIEFISGDNPWQPGGYWAFGPCGDSKSIDQIGFGARRRQRHLDVLRTLNTDYLNTIVKNLAIGRSSLFN